ncbi:MAG: 23S rRNA (guanosine(2251)-2'-O)-methyltransferase RlmB [Prevotella sp.]|nr:23S rRNA (guanosine(2251)-2'-O)-methyltransferase RlmB [Prevotella sp.]MCM1074199.1 23S rRNA (guanosine(2251)-2'-O)-methyltransferase RlmB [Ruminococcus sp.]
MLNKSEYIFGLRAVIEAIDAGKEIDKVLLRKDLAGGELSRELQEKIRERGIVVQRVPVEKLNRITMKNHQGVIALLSMVNYYSLSQLVPTLYEEGSLPFILLLDGITDTRNFGAIARTAECAGVDAIVIPERHSVSVNADAVKTSAGALLHIPVCREHSIASAVRFLKDSGLTVVGATEKGADEYTNVDYTAPVAIVMGAEDTGISAEVLKQCDCRAAIPIIGAIGSLNVSVAAGVMLYESVRQRLASGLSHS